MKIFNLVLLIIILISFILIGTPISYNCTILTLSIIVIGIIFCIYKFFIKQEEILNSKLDWIMLLFCLTPLIPLLFNTYVSLNDTVTSLLKYISCFVIYLLVKNLLKKNSNEYSMITITFIICSSLLSIIGIDKMTTNYLGDILESLGLPYVINVEKRMLSSLGYANSFAIILAISIILNIDILNNKKNRKYELLFSGTLFLNLSCLFLTYSRTVIILLAIFFIIFCIINKEKWFYTFGLFIANSLLGLIYIMMWNTTWLVWPITIMLFAISCILSYFINKYELKMKKINKKTSLIIFGIVLILMVLIVYIGTKLDVPLVIFKQGNSSDEVKYKIQNIEGNKEYTLKFNLDAKSVVNNIENYHIVVKEENKYYDEVCVHEISFNNFSGEKEISFTTTSETIELALYFRSNIKIAQKGLTINSFTINGEEHPLNYLFLPVSLVDKLKDITIKDKSVWERGTYYKDALKIIKNNIFTGLGSNAWKYNYIKVQSYNYASTEVHSYIIQLLLEYGIVALIIFILILCLIFIDFIKKLKENGNVTIYLALFLLVFHSIVDFDMSFYFIMLTLFILIGLLPTREKIKRKNSFIFGLLISIFVFSEIIGIINFVYNPKTYIEKLNINLYNKNYNEIVNNIKKIRKREKSQLYFDILMKLDYSNLSKENLEYIYDLLITIPVVPNIEYTMQRNRIIKQILNSSNNKDLNKQFAQIVIDQNQSTINMINNKDKNRLKDVQIKSYLNEENSIYNLSLKYEELTE